MLRHLCHEAVDLLLPAERSRGIVRIRDEDLARPRRDRGRHGVQIVLIAGVRHFHRGRAEERGHQLVDNKRMLRGDHFIPGLEEGMAHELDDLVRAVPQHHIVHLHAELLRDSPAQFPAAAVGIDFGVFQCLAHRLHGLPAWSQWVLVAGQLHDVSGIQAKFAGYLFDRLAGFIGNEVAQLRVGVVPDG